jgi:hypothetical protein
MNCLSIRAEVDVPAIPADPAPAALAPPTPAVPTVVPHAAVFTVEGETVGIVGANKLGITVFAKGDMFVVGIAGAELTPRLVISVESNGIPAGAAPPGVVGDVDVGVDDEAMLVEPEPHIPDIPDVSSIPEDVDIPEVAEIPDDVDIPGIVIVSCVAVPVVTVLPVVVVPPVIVMVPVVAAVAGAAVPADVPPPS